MKVTYSEEIVLLPTDAINQMQKEARTKLYAQFVNDGDLIFNVGASFGDRTEIFADLGAKVIALEPQPQMATILRDRFNGREEVTIIEAAAGAEMGTIDLMICGNNPIPLATAEPAWIKSIEEKYCRNWPMEDWNHKITVEQVTLDSLIDRYGVPDFVKIDVDGWERFVLQGLNQKVPRLCFEVTIPYGEPGIGCVTDVAERLGFTEFNYLIQETMQLILEEWVDAESMAGILRSLPVQVFFVDVFAR